MQLVQFLSTLQEAPPVFSNAISEACTTHSWEFFCCFSGRIFGGTVSTEIRVTLSFISLSILRGGADKSLARPGRKQATATKLGIIQHIPLEAQHTS
jgi:hypothetical protein